MPDSPGRTRHDGDDGGTRRQRALAGGLEQALGRKPRLERLEAEREVSKTGRLQRGDVQLVDAARVVDVDPAVGDDAQSRLRLERRGEPIVTEPDAGELAALVLEREVAVAGARDRHAADLALDPHVAEPGIAADRVFHGTGDVADGEDLQRDRRRLGGPRARCRSGRGAGDRPCSPSWCELRQAVP